MLALPLLNTRAAGGHAAKTAGAAAASSHYGYFPGPLHMPRSHEAAATAAGEVQQQHGQDSDGAIKASVASLMSLPVMKAFCGEEGGKRRELVEKGALSMVGMAEKMRTHK